MDSLIKSQLAHQEDGYLNKLQSETINLLRFPLAIGVVLLHYSPKTSVPIEGALELFSLKWFLNIFQILISHVLTHACVPVFFIISGLLFFMNVEDYTRDNYLAKIRKRIKSILIPYILWITLAFLPLMLINFAMMFKHGINIHHHAISLQMFWNSVRVSEFSDWLGNTHTSYAPLIVPLWFLRDLFVATLLTPISYYFLKRWGIATLCLLLLCNITRVWLHIPGFSIGAIFYFSLGAYFSIHKLNLVAFVRKYRKPILISAIPAVVLMTILDSAFTHIGSLLYPLMVLFLTGPTIYIFSELIVRFGFRANTLLVSSGFFLYALHAFPFPIIGAPIVFFKIKLLKLFEAYGAAGELLSYILAPTIVIALCIGIYQLSRLLFPKLTSILSGGR